MIRKLYLQIHAASNWPTDQLTNRPTENVNILFEQSGMATSTLAVIIIVDTLACWTLSRHWVSSVWMGLVDDKTKWNKPTKCIRMSDESEQLSTKCLVWSVWSIGQLISLVSLSTEHYVFKGTDKPWFLNFFLQSIQPWCLRVSLGWVYPMQRGLSNPSGIV